MGVLKYYCDKPTGGQMAKLTSCNKKDIEIMCKLRSVGFSFREIRDTFDGEIPESTIQYHCRDVSVDKSKKRAMTKKLSALFMSWQPGTPLEELPFPPGLIEVLREK